MKDAHPLPKIVSDMAKDVGQLMKVAAIAILVSVTLGIGFVATLIIYLIK